VSHDIDKLSGQISYTYKDTLLNLSKMIKQIKQIKIASISLTGMPERYYDNLNSQLIIYYFVNY